MQQTAGNNGPVHVCGIAQLTLHVRVCVYSARACRGDAHELCDSTYSCSPPAAAWWEGDRESLVLIYIRITYGVHNDVMQQVHGKKVSYLQHIYV